MISDVEERRFLELASRVRLQHDIFNRVSFEWVVDPGVGLGMIVHCRAPDLRLPAAPDGRDVPEVPLVARFSLDARPILDLAEVNPEGAVRVLYETAREFLLRAIGHEIDEMLVVDGNRIGDPHPEDQPDPTGLLDVLHDDTMQARLRATYERDRRERRTP